MAVTLKNINKSFGDKVVLSNINLSLAGGTINCVMGPSGIGKTTLANILAGLLPPDSGEIRGLAGQRVSFVFQEDRLLDWENALTNVLFVMKKPDEPLAAELLTRAGLGDSLRKKARFLSGGMKRRVAICRALAAEYDILILDEPFKGLDGALKISVMDMVKERAGGKLLVCITHDEKEAQYLGGTPIFLE